MREIMSIIKAAAAERPNTIPNNAIILEIGMKRKPMNDHSVDQIWIVSRDTMPSTPASSVFNLNPAGFPISHTQPVRNKWLVTSSIKFETNRQAGLA